MPRRPEPWYRQGRGCWYVQVDGKQVRLDPDEKRARALWHRLMADRGRMTEEEARSLTVLEVADLFLSSREGRRPQTLRTYEKYLVPFAKAHGATRLADLRASDVVAYCRLRPGWSDGTRRLVFSRIVTFLRWSRDAGHLRFNPMAGADNPWTRSHARRPMTAEEYRRLVDVIRDPELRLAVRVLWSTGARPSEVYNLEARHLHPLRPVATLQPSEHKTGGRTGRCRYIIFPPGLMDELRARARAHPSGPILRNAIGRRWTVGTVCRRFSEYREQLNLSPDVVPYSARHAFCTNLAAANPQQSPLLLARIVGHSDAATFQSVYFHPDMDAMIEIVGREDGEGRPIESPTPDGFASEDPSTSL